MLKLSSGQYLPRTLMATRLTRCGHFTLPVGLEYTTVAMTCLFW
jgi:hypothetical protein